MTLFRKNRVCVLAVLMALVYSGVNLPAMAQDAQAPKKNNFGPRIGQSLEQPDGAGTSKLPVPEVIATHGDWKLQCETMQEGTTQETAAPDKKQCGMVQTARSDKNPKVGLTLVMVKTRQNDKDIVMMRVMAPIGVFLPTGVALEIDGTAIGRVPFTRCLPQVCIAFAEAQATTLEKMRKGNAANFIIYEAPGLGLPMKISLSGFSAAYDALNKL